ncbi:MAG: alanine racemase [Opitutaceae bacterium]|nr:alanine racemase [Opitutaceae bacterium]
MSQSATTPYRCWAEIDLAALERNLKSIRADLPDYIKYIAVVKADAYGHGMQQTVARLMQANVDMFAVANVLEAAKIREIGTGWPIIVLGATLENEESYLFEYDLIPTISTIEEVERLNRKARSHEKPLKAHIKIDTGMGRLGIWHEYATELFDAFHKATFLTLGGVYTHFASASRDPEFTRRQRQLFTETIAKVDWLETEKLLIHADNSAGISTFAPDSVYNAVRIGLLQFGIAPYPLSMLGEVDTTPIFEFKSRVGIVKELPAGATISYGRSRTLQRDSRVAIVCAGYGDGVPLKLSDRGDVLISGERCPILGQVTMDQTIVDVTDIEGVVKSGDSVTLIGPQGEGGIRLQEFSEWAETIPWEILCSVTKRVPRIYRTAIITG